MATMTTQELLPVGRPTMLAIGRQARRFGPPQTFAAALLTEAILAAVEQLGGHAAAVVTK
jgi:hypothetical protein